MPDRHLEMEDGGVIFRVRSDLKKDVEEAFLFAGSNKKQSGKFLKRALARLVTKF